MRVTITTSVALLATLLLFAVSSSASHTPLPTSVTIAGSLQSELGCGGDWDPGCAATHLEYDAADGVWQKAFPVPAGSYEYKAALNNSWGENYGLHAVFDGGNVPLTLASSTTVKFYYDHESHWITDSKSSVIATVPGSFQSALGCPGDWDPGCLRSWLQDVDGDGTYVFQTTSIPQGNYEAKVAINEAWDENYGAGGVPGGPNIAFSVPADAKVTFTYVAATHVLTIDAVAPGNVEWDGLAHDSRNTLYRAPGGAVPAGTPVHLRFRTFHDDVTGVSARLYSVKSAAQTIVPMTRVATDVSCYDAALAARTCDFWQTTLPNATPDVVWYRFIVTDGNDVDFYGDDSEALDGGLGAASDDAVDRSYALSVYDPSFTTPTWARDAVVYQIFPDRFANGEKKNDPKTGDARYDDPVVALPWNTLPEGYCRNYSDADGTTCPWRFDTSPPDWSPLREGPRGRDYMGGDLQGVIKKLDYLKKLGIDTIYFNPIFAAKSNHRYDTADYTTVDPALGELKDFEKLVKEAKKAGIRIVLDGVFNHMSSDSAFFDRYHHYATDGACESLASAWRPWFVFHNENVPCGAADYDGWFGFDSIPTLQKSNPDVQRYFLDGPNAISKLWLDRGAAGWRLDVMGDSSFPGGYWEKFRQVVKAADKDALIVGELWPKDATTLRFLTGDRADSTMNYRLRDAIIGLLAPHSFDPKGLGGGGQQLNAAAFATRLASIQEDYAPQAFDVLMNLIDSHDTERALWTLTPGAETRAEREQNAANLADGKRRLRLASFLQFTLPGMPTVYYGDEVGLTGDDDPDDRRTYPWADTGGSPDSSLESWYSSLAKLRSQVKALSVGDLRILDAGASVAAYGRRTDGQAAIVAVNPTDVAQSVDIPLAGYVPDGSTLERRLGAGTVVVAGGKVSLTLAPQSGEVLVTKGKVDLEAPSAPTSLAVASEGSHEAAVTWQPVAGAASYAVYASPVTGGGYVRAGTTGATSFTLTGLPNAKTAYVVVRALDAAGNESGASNEVAPLPHLTIGWANLQWPPALSHTISVVNRTDNVYGQVWIDGATNAPGRTPTLGAQLGFGPSGSAPAANAAWTWVDAAFNADSGNNDEFVASLLPEAVGSYDYVYRYTTTGGRDWAYADQNGPFNGPPPNPGHLTVNASADSSAPATPSGLHVVSASPAGVELAWDAVAGDPTLYGYEVFRDGKQVARVTSAAFADHAVVEGETYHYAVRSLDSSFNRSQLSPEVAATAEVRDVTIVFNLTVPSATDGTGRTPNIAGTLSRLAPPAADWDPAGFALTRVDATHWRTTVHALENTQLEYKYALGSWDYVEKDDVCGEIANRLLTVSYGATGTQTVSDTTANWRNVAPCGN